MRHELKTLPSAWLAGAEGRRRVEIRRDDRGINDGDLVMFREWEPADGYTGRQYMALVTHVLRRDDLACGSGLAEGFAALSVIPLWDAGWGAIARVVAVVESSSPAHRHDLLRAECGACVLEAVRRALDGPP